MALGLLTLALLGGCTQSDPSGRPTAKAAVDAYVAGLNARDPHALRQLAPPGNDAESDIARRLATHGGQNIAITSADLTSDATPDGVSARLRGKGTKGAYSEILVVARCGDLWCVALGMAPSYRAPAQIHRP
ncbi:hypothetical protein Ssi02_52160 [Sinosporangium siamense]|uniref:Uncharacterized protein n=2 Tax=Sinosporangium siamense TaxID=1367973 RepID=A0A919RLE5_9ACTN|nr:hypothetical protein Ssi02_52160 [Sinosporangium siamense]